VEFQASSPWSTVSLGRIRKDTAGQRPSEEDNMEGHCQEGACSQGLSGAASILAK
ncbi:hypothetical protein NDU88_002792, partial [Pleurodeles waltl]